MITPPAAWLRLVRVASISVQAAQPIGPQVPVFSSRRRHTRWNCDWSSDVCSSDLKTNKQAGKPTLPQSLILDQNGRMLVISGPNAGVKSITLKTIGLLQKIGR